jgi:hypothetical protein
MGEASKGVLTKILAILGFCVTIALIIWLIITIIAKAPGAFRSLAGIADDINLHKELSALEVTPEKDVVNSGEPFTLTWTDTDHEGTYQVGYACADGMTVFFQDPDETFHPMRCGADMLSLPAEVTDLTLIASSTKDRVTDVTFRVLFSESTTTTPIEGTAKVTVMNPEISVGATTTPVRIEEEPDETPVSSVPASQGSGTQQASVPHAVTTSVYPQSDPNGYADLAVTVKEAAALDRYSEYAVSFMVKNIGTKTSGAWSFHADLPGSEDYASTQYAGLKPQEYMLFTMTFPIPGYTYAEPQASFTVFTAGDTNTGNNTASTATH